MTRLLLALALIALPGTAGAAVRTYTIGSFERIRVEGPFEVRLTAGQSPGARAEADAATLRDVNVRVEGGTLIVSIGVNGWNEQASTPGSAPVVTLSTPVLRAAQVNGGGRLTIAGMRGQRVDLAVSGSGSLAASGIAADRLNASLVGYGEMTLAGRAAKVRLATNGPGSIDAGGLTADDLTVLLDGAGETRADARYTAQVTSTGIGRVIVTGTPSCSVTAVAGGPVSCGRVPSP